MYRYNTPLEEKCVQSEKLLEEAREEVRYYQGIAEENGIKCFREIDQLSKIINYRKQSEEMLRENEEKYRTVMEAHPDPVIVYDLNDRVVYLNPAFTRLFGWTLQERIGKKMEGFVPEGNRTETNFIANKLLIGDAFCNVETCRYTKDGRTVHVSINGSVYRDKDSNPIGNLITLRDISEQKKMEAQLRQTQKMEALGTLAGGIAHDFNNILSIIIGYTEIESRNATDDSVSKNNLIRALEAGKRAKELVNQILSFSRQGEHELKPVHIGFIVKEVLKLMRASLPAIIEIHQHIENGLGLVKADPTQIYQVLMNLCSNAAYAMNNKGGVLKVTLAKMNPHPYLSLTVSDTGCGIAPEILDRIFEPYFTTKEKGEGTGLGLATVHGIVKSHGGTITVESEPDKGATFHIFLPLVQDVKEAAETGMVKPLPTGHECLLFVDDKPGIAHIGKEMLDRLGYEVYAGTGSMDILGLIREEPDKFDLIISDMTMPDMTGERLAREILKLCPNVPIILCTEFNEKRSREKARAMGIREFIMKPFSIQDIAVTIRKVLDNN